MAHYLSTLTMAFGLWIVTGLRPPHNPRMNADAQQRRCAPPFRAGYAHRWIKFIMIHEFDHISFLYL